MSVVDRLYYTAFNEDEDARACEDIPEDACRSVPGNFARLLASSTATSLADELANGKTVLAWLMTSIGAASFWTGLIVPVRESMSMLPQLGLGGYIRRMPLRKHAWALGGVLQAAALTGIGLVALFLRGPGTGPAVIGLLLLFSLARALTSLTSKDVIGKTIPKKRRGRLTGAKSALAGVLTLVLGLIVARLVGEDAPPELIGALILGAAALWLIATGVFLTIPEQPGATGGDVNGLKAAFSRLSVLRTDRAFRRFVLTRALFISTALAGPYYVVLAREYGAGGSVLGFFIVASGLASAVSSLVWGSFADRSSRNVLAVAAGVASVLGVAMFVMDAVGVLKSVPMLAPVAFFVLAMAHSGVRIGRKTYVLDLAGGEKRTDYVAVGNTIIGLILLISSAVGALSSIIGPSGVLLVLAAFGFAGVALSFTLPQVE